MRNSLKKCSSCGSEKPLSEFNKSKSTPDGLDYRCRDCAKAHSKRYREQHPENWVMLEKGSTATDYVPYGYL